MGGKNRAKKLVGHEGATSSKKKGSASVKVANKDANRLARQAGVADLTARGGSVEAKRASKASNKADRAASRASDSAAGAGSDAASRKKKSLKRKHGVKGASSGAPSVQQMKQHAHEPRAMSKHDASYNARAQLKAEKRKKGGAAGGAEEAAVEEDDEPESNAADARFFARNEGMAGFLNALNPDELNKKKGDKPAPNPRFPAQQPKSKSSASSSHSSDDEEGSDDDSGSESGGEDDGSDSSGSGSGEDADGPAKKKARGERGVASFERNPRKASWAADADKVPKGRLPVRSEDGSWVASEVTKADTLRARAERIELMQQRKAGPAAASASAVASAVAPDSDSDGDIDDEGDLEMGDADAAASASEGEEESKEEVEEDGIAAMSDDDDDSNSEDGFDDTLEDEDEDLEAELEVEDAKDVLSGAAASASPAVSSKLREQQERRQMSVKLELAESSELILENPDKHMGKLEGMLQLCTDADPTILQLSLLSVVEVLVDLIPSYRIRLPSVEESSATNLSKDVKATWKFERNFLLYYGRAVTTILAALATPLILGKQTNDQKVVSPLARNILRCACRLLEKGYHFNYRKELVHALSPLLNHGAPAVRLLVFQCLISVFRADISGESTLEIVRVLSKIVKTRGRKVQLELLQSFLYLPLHKEIIQATVVEKKAPIVKKKGHSYTKVDDRGLNKDLGESEATVSLATRKKVQTQCLTEVMACYFRILKQDRTAKVLPVVLRGLSKFATLIDVELVLDLLDCLKSTLTRESDSEDGGESLSVESTLYVILTSFQTLQSHGQALAMDLKEFYNCLYGLLFRFCCPSEVVHLPLLLQCLHLMFHETKQLSLDRVAAFIQRLCSLALYVPPHASLAILHAVRLCLNKYPRCKQLLDREVSAPGVFLAELDDPDVSNAMASTLWELGLLKDSFHPFIPIYAQSVLEDAPLPLSLARTTPLNLFENYDASEGGFNPPLPLPAAFLSQPGGSGSGIGVGSGTSTSMRKKLDLRRRMRLAELELAQREERLQSTFLRNVISEARLRDAKTPKEKPTNGQERLERLQAIQTQYTQYKQQQKQQQKQVAGRASNGNGLAHQQQQKKKQQQG